MKTNDFIKYLTQEFVTYTNKPREERKKHRLERHEQQKDYSTELFGLVPFALKMALKKNKNKA